MISTSLAARYLTTLTGFPYPENAALASHLESVVRLNGAIPATIGVLHGVARIGLESEELVQLCSSAGKPDTVKVSTRDLSYICGLVQHQRLLTISTLSDAFTSGSHRT